MNGNFFVGLALSKDVEENLRPTIKDAERDKRSAIGFTSQFFGEQRKDNPKAKNARFRVDNVVVGDEPIEVFINDKKVAEIRIENIKQVFKNIL